MPNTPTDMCPNGHDKRIVGTRNRMCKECRREFRRQQWANATPEEKARVYKLAKDRYQSGATQTNITVMICPKGHDKRIVGVCKNGACRQCFNEHDAIRRQSMTETDRERQRLNGRKHYAESYAPIRRRQSLLANYGLTEETYKAMLIAQRGVCAICQEPETRTRNGKVQTLHIDHDHKTDKVRALLCSSCNVMLGYALDDPQLLISAAEYLFRFQPEPSPALR